MLKTPTSCQISCDLLHRLHDCCFGVVVDVGLFEKLINKAEKENKKTHILSYRKKYNTIKI